VRFSLALLAVVFAALATSVGYAAPTQDQLAVAVLTPADLGPGFTQVQSGPVEDLTQQGVANHMAVYTRMTGVGRPTFTIVLDALTDAAASDALPPTDPTEQLGMLKSFGVTATPVDAPAIGQNTVKLALSGNVFGQPLDGDCIFWRHAGVIAAVCALGAGNPSAEGYALRQQEKLVAQFGE
jgi:hypothetical protein